MRNRSSNAVEQHKYLSSTGSMCSLKVPTTVLTGHLSERPFRSGKVSVIQVTG